MTIKDLFKIDVKNEATKKDIYGNFNNENVEENTLAFVNSRENAKRYAKENNLVVSDAYPAQDIKCAEKFPTFWDGNDVYDNEYSKAVVGLKNSKSLGECDGNVWIKRFGTIANKYMFELLKTTTANLTYGTEETKAEYKENKNKTKATALPCNEQTFKYDLSIVATINENTAMPVMLRIVGNDAEDVMQSFLITKLDKNVWANWLIANNVDPVNITPFAIVEELNRIEIALNKMAEDVQELLEGWREFHKEVDDINLENDICADKDEIDYTKELDLLNDDCLNPFEL